MIKRKSYFKNPVNDYAWFDNWVSQIETLNGKKYQRYTLDTALGKTTVWGINTNETSLDALVIFPGFRTSPLFWDLNNGLSQLGQKLRIYLVETNGQPNTSDGNSPSIRSNNYGIWASEVLDKLQLPKAFVAGASFGGLVCMKLALVAPQKIKAAFLLNAGCLQTFSLGLTNLYYNLLPIVAPSEKNVKKFLYKAVFYPPEHLPSPEAEKLITAYQMFALTRYKDRTQKPYYMNKELDGVTVDTYVLEGDKDVLFPYEKSIANAQKHIRSLKDVKVFANVGHGIETYAPAIKYIQQIVEIYQNGNTSIH